ncbi:MAG: hypothetical protein AAF528_00185 [Cyanobacteria bacterium P01_C01_bin.121]
MSDKQRAEDLEKYLLYNIIREPGASAASIALIFLRHELRENELRDLDNHDVDIRQRIRKKGINFAKKLKSLEELVKVIASLREAERNPPGNLRKNPSGSSKNTGIIFDLNVSLSPENILRAFQIFTQLTAQELQALNLPTHSQHPLLQQAFLNLATFKSSEGEKHILNLYRDIYRSSINWNGDISENPPLQSKEDVDSYIDNKVNNTDDQVKIKRAIDRLLLQAGTGQARFIEIEDQDHYIRNHINRSFIDRFIQTIIINNKLTKEFPVYLKRIAIEPIGPFPLPVGRSDPGRGLFLIDLLKVCHPLESDLYTAVDRIFDQLPTRTVSKVIGYFYIRLKDTMIGHSQNYRGFSYEVYQRIRTQIGEQIRVPFTVSSTGIGGTNSHITKIINAALLGGIDCFRQKYFPIAHDVFIEQSIIDNRVPSPVWSHSFVHLCDNDTMSDAMKSSSTEAKIYRYDDLGSYGPEGRGDYCSFDAVLSTNKAAFHARLQAIKNTGTTPEDYLYSLLSRVEQQFLLDEAKSLIKGYPFFSFALESWLQKEMFSKTQEQSYQEIPYILYNARLTIVETFLEEGAYRNAYEYLETVKKDLDGQSKIGIRWLQLYRESKHKYNSNLNETHAERSDQKMEDDFKVISGSLMAHYEFCIAKYLYTLDWQTEINNGQDQYFLNLFDKGEITQTTIIVKAWQALDRAEKHLTVRIAKYHVVDEVSQATFHPHYQLLSKIYLLRAQFFIWFPTKVAPDGTVYRPPTQSTNFSHNSMHHRCRGLLFFLERARVYAACDGDDELYVTCTAYQSWAWLMTSFLMTEESLALESHGSAYITKQDCWAWSRRLRNHALLKYAKIGQECYHAIKEKSGLSGELSRVRGFGQYAIDPIPVIRETIGESPGCRTLPQAEYTHGGIVGEIKVLYLDMQSLALPRGAIDPDNPDSSQTIYLFGPKACYLFFIRGLYHLCSDDKEEFKSQKVTPKNQQEWDQKLEYCYRLFNYAWAIADDGCKIEQVAKGETKWQIKRYVDRNGRATSDPHVASVWDLYPYRMTEIADLGKVFAAVCAVLRLYTSSKRQDREQEIDCLLTRLHKQPAFRNDAVFKAALKGQKRYNRHFESYLSNCKKNIRDVQNEAQVDKNSMLETRHELVSKIFELTAL